MMFISMIIAFVLLQVYTLLVIVLRGKLFKVPVYRPMILNLFLSLSPLVIQIVSMLVVLVLAATTIENGASDIVVGIIRGILLLNVLVWALFFPNATYLITELNFSHRKKNDTVPEYYDIIMVFTLATTGFVNALVSLSFFHFLVLMISDPSPGVIPVYSWAIVVGYSFLSSFAIYLGRNIRVNSWDLLHPIKFTQRLVRHFKDKNSRKTAMGYTVFFSIPLIIAHAIAFNLIYGFITN